MAGYTRQSSYSDGDTITAAHTNDEFNQLEAAFNADTGHDHSGAGEGGPIASLASHGITFGARTAGTDITVTWAGEDNDGVLKWMEDEDYFVFSDDILIASTEKLQFGDTATFLQQSSDGVLRIDGEATIDLNASTAVTVSNDLKLDSDSAVLGFGSDNDVTLTHVADTALLLNSTRQLQFGDSGTYIHQSADGVLDLVSDTEIEINATTVDLNGNLDVSGTFTLASTALSSTAAELNLLDGSSAGTIVNSKALIYGSSGEVNATTLQIAGTSINSTAAELNLMDGGTSAGTTAVAGTDGIVTNDGGTMRQTTVDTFDTYLAQTTKTLTNKTLTTPVIAEIDSGADITLDATADIILDAGGANIIFKDDGTSILDIANNSSDVELTVSVADKNFAIKGTDGSSAITALDIDMELAGKATFNGDVVVGGDLTVTGDDITMGTNTAGNLLVADGTNFNSVTVGSLSEISTVANDDVFLAVDTSDSNALKKITRSAIVSGLASSGAISNVVEDTSPQLGANLDTNSHNILIDDAHFIADENGNEQIIFQTTTSAVNQFDITNAATGNPPLLSATGGDTNIDLDLSAKGTGHVTVRGGTNSGAIQFNCEDNSHGQIVIAQPHSASVTNTLTLPAGSSSTLVSLVSTDTLTNKTLTSPVLNTATVGTSIVPSSADGATLGTASVEFSDLFLADGGTVQFGNDQDVTLTHVADTGLLLNSTMQLQFNDASQFINAPSATVLDINATDEIELNATLVDVNANLDVSGTYTGGGLMTTGGNIVIPDAGNIGSASDTDAIAIGADGDVTLTQDLELQHDAATLSFGADNDVVLTHVADTGLLLNSTMAIQFNDASQFINAPSATVLDINATDEIELNATLADVNANLDVSGTYTGGGLMTTGGNIVIPDTGNIGSASDTDALAIAANGVVNFTQQPTVASAAVKVAGKETIWIPAAAMYPETTNGCSDLTQVELANGPELKCLDFATGSDEFAQFTVAFPKSWDRGDVQFKAYFTVTGTHTGTTAWGLAGGSFSDNGDLNTAFGTAEVATAKAHSGTSNDLNITAESGDMTIAGSPADEDLCFFQVFRDVSADDQSGDSRLLGIKLYFTTDAANDA